MGMTLIEHGTGGPSPAYVHAWTLLNLPLPASVPAGQQPGGCSCSPAQGCRVSRQERVPDVEGECVTLRQRQTKRV